MQTEPSTAEPPKRKRRWFQFSLRTLMIGVTLLAVPLGYVAWHARVVRERKELLSLVLNRGGGYLISDEPALSGSRLVGTLPPSPLGPGGFPPNQPFMTLSIHDVTKNPSWIRIWFGDERMAAIWLTTAVSADEAARIVAAFPESNVCQDIRNGEPASSPSQ